MTPVNSIDSQLFHGILASEDTQLIDLRERAIKNFDVVGALHLPFSELDKRLAEISKEKKVILFCEHGELSFFATYKLQAKHGFTNLLNLKGGILEAVNTFPELKLA